MIFTIITGNHHHTKFDDNNDLRCQLIGQWSECQLSTAMVWYSTRKDRDASTFQLELISWLVCWSVGWSVGRLVGWLVGKDSHEQLIHAYNSGRLGACRWFQGRYGSLLMAGQRGHLDFLPLPKGDPNREWTVDPQCPKNTVDFLIC